MILHLDNIIIDRDDAITIMRELVDEHDEIIHDIIDYVEQDGALNNEKMIKHNYVFLCDDRDFELVENLSYLLNATENEEHPEIREELKKLIKKHE